MSPYRIALIGAGARAFAHARPYDSIDDAEVVAICNRDPGRRSAFLKRYAVRTYADPEQMLRAEKPDLVHIITPPSARVELMTLVSDLGVPGCIVEKPVAWQVSDWRALAALERNTQTRFGVGAQFRYHPNLIACRNALASGRLGQTLFVEASAGLNICDQGVHTLDWAMSLLGDPAPVRILGQVGGADQLHSRHPAPNDAVAEVWFDNGVRMLWTLGAAAPRVGGHPETYKHCRVAAYAEDGYASFEEFGRWLIHTPEGEQTGLSEDLADPVESNGAAQLGLTRAMLAWLAGGEPVGTNLRRALQQWNAILGLYASALWRRPVELPFDPPDDLWERLVAALDPASIGGAE